MPVCRSCGSAIEWGETPAGKRAPFDPDGTNHFVTCPDARVWRKAHGTDLPAEQPIQQSFVEPEERR
jgi:hypothetical protein